MNKFRDMRCAPWNRLASLCGPALALCLISVACGTANGQDASDDQLTEWVQVQVAAGFMIPGQGAYGTASLAAQAQARRAIYEMAAQECNLLRATIAKECRLQSFNVNVNPQYGQGAAEAWANATFNLHIRLK